ncbi:hypothetical protein CXB35_03250 [Pseudomonas syringae]|nr:hypothetical protein CXB35_03250 [Pseudomonas syringae]
MQTIDIDFDFIRTIALRIGSNPRIGHRNIEGTFRPSATYMCLNTTSTILIWRHQFAIFIYVRLRFTVTYDLRREIIIAAHYDIII